MIRKYFLIFLLITNFLYATTKEDIFKSYEAKDYSDACLKSGNLYQEYKNDEDFLTIFADSCLQIDMINSTILPIVKLYKSKKARENAAYFATILYEKKLLYYALIDDVDISYINLPKTKYILSIIFDKFVKKNYDFKNGAYWFTDDTDKELTYKLSAEENQEIKKIFLRTYKNNEIIKIRTYR